MWLSETAKWGRGGRVLVSEPKIQSSRCGAKQTNRDYTALYRAREVRSYRKQRAMQRFEDVHLILRAGGLSGPPRFCIHIIGGEFRKIKKGGVEIGRDHHRYPPKFAETNETIFPLIESSFDFVAIPPCSGVARLQV